MESLMDRRSDFQALCALGSYISISIKLTIIKFNAFSLKCGKQMTVSNSLKISCACNNHIGKYEI